MSDLEYLASRCCTLSLKVHDHRISGVADDDPEAERWVLRVYWRTTVGFDEYTGDTAADVIMEAVADARGRPVASCR